MDHVPLFLAFVAVAVASAGPVIERFSLDMDKGILALTFSEPVSDAAENINWAGVSLRTHVNGLEGFGVPLVNTQDEHGWGVAAATEEGSTLTVQIHPVDLDDMKAAHVGDNSSFIWITVQEGAFFAIDGSGGNEPVYGTQVLGHKGISVSELVQDTTSPTLDRFTLASTSRELVLFFSEGVGAPSTLDPSALSLSWSHGDSDDPALVQSKSPSASLLCSSTELGRRQGSSRSASRREVLLRLDEPCAVVTTNSSSNATSAGAADSIAADSTLLGDGANATLAETYVGGYPSDWVKLVAAGVLFENDGGGGSTAWRATGGMPLLLNATSDLVTDLSAAANPLIAVVNLEESFPNCQPCGNGTFRSEPCTEVYDAMCSPCTQACAGGDSFVLAACTAETDLDCHRCTPCPFGTREICECQQSSDRLCEACTECEEWEYESRECSTSGDDTICETCLRDGWPGTA